MNHSAAVSLRFTVFYLAHPTPPAASRATASAPTRCRPRSRASAPCRSCRRSPGSRVRRTASVVGRSPGGACPRRCGRCRITCRAKTGAPTACDRGTGEGDRRSLVCHSEAGRVGRARAYSMSWSARPSTDGGIVSPSSFAVLRLITSSNLVGCWTGRSAGFAPLRILST